MIMMSSVGGSLNYSFSTVSNTIHNTFYWQIVILLQKNVFPSMAVIMPKLEIILNTLYPV